MPIVNKFIENLNRITLHCREDSSMKITIHGKKLKLKGVPHLASSGIIENNVMAQANMVAISKVAGWEARLLDSKPLEEVRER